MIGYPVRGQSLNFRRSVGYPGSVTGWRPAKPPVIPEATSLPSIGTAAGGTR
jgi:hypothetical protein